MPKVFMFSCFYKVIIYVARLLPDKCFLISFFVHVPFLFSLSFLFVEVFNLFMNHFEFKIVKDEEIMKNKRSNVVMNQKKLAYRFIELG